MPLVLPALGGLAAGYFAAAAGWTLLGSSLLAAVAAGAVVGGVIGGVQSAIQGGNILEGVLFGAVGGAIGGAIGGYFGAAQFGMSASEYLSGSGVVITDSGTGVVAPAASVSKVKALEASSTLTKGGALTTSDKLILAQGSLGALQGMNEPEGLSRDDQLSEAERNRELQRELANIAASRGSGSDAYRVAQLQAEVAREDMARKGTEFQQTLAFQDRQLQTPIEEENKRRQAMRDTLIGTKVVSKVEDEEEQSALLPA